VKALVAAALLLAASARAATTNNDDSCDIAVQPAATLLLPYFEVDLGAAQPAPTTTLISIQNVSASPVTANVTVWTDWAYPALNFPIQLTGYDVEGIDLRDVLKGGALPSSACASGPLSPGLLDDLHSLFITGKSTGASIACTAQVGGVHALATGYVTIDVVAGCSATNVTSPGYFSTLRYDNVLTGDYQQLGTAQGRVYASGGPLVHIRAIPEGGAAGVVMATQLPHTFYERYMPDPLAQHADRRQPLPSAFAPRWISGGTTGFNTNLKIWREGMTTGSCAGAQRAGSNSEMVISETVRFDEHENATVTGVLCSIGCLSPPGLPAASSVSSISIRFSPLSISGDPGGWLYINLDNQSTKTRSSQNWVIVSMLAAPAYATEATAPALGNGCSTAAKPGARIGPLP
jgi:hypothetical protein